LKAKINISILVFSLATILMSCVKELVGPETDVPLSITTPGPTGPAGPTGVTGPTGPTGLTYGSLVFYTKFTDFNIHCSSINVTIDSVLAGTVNEVYTGLDPVCYDSGTLTIDSLEPGSYNIFIGKCGELYETYKVNVTAGICTTRKVL